MLRVVLLLALTAQSVFGCGTGWLQFKDSCIIFIHTPRSWLEAAKMCTIFGSTLAQIDSKEKQNWFVKELDSLPDFYDDVWIGGSTILSATWEWIPSLKPIKSYTNWAPNEPNKPYFELCLTLRSGVGRLWNNADCDNPKHFVCERKAD